jgi:hypothetical protein
VFVSDLQHFLDMPDDAPGPARRMAQHLTMIVRAATAGDTGLPWVSALTCIRRPNHRACPGNLMLRRVDVPSSIEWQCPNCGDDGVISGWEHTPFDLRRRDNKQTVRRGVDVTVSPEVAHSLRSLTLLDTTSEQIFFRARASHDGIIILHGSEDDLDELLGYIAAEANHEHNRLRQKRLDAAFEILHHALENTIRP